MLFSILIIFTQLSLIFAVVAEASCECVYSKDIINIISKLSDFCEKHGIKDDFDNSDDYDIAVDRLSVVMHNNYMTDYNISAKLCLSCTTKIFQTKYISSLLKRDESKNIICNKYSLPNECIQFEVSEISNLNNPCKLFKYKNTGMQLSVTDKSKMEDITIFRWDSIQKYKGNIPE